MKADFDRVAVADIDSQLGAEEKRHIAERARLKQMKIDLVDSPKVGDTVTIKDGYSYTGKRLLIDRIGFGRWSEKLEAYGVIIKANGEPGKARASEPLEKPW